MLAEEQRQKALPCGPKAVAAGRNRPCHAGRKTEEECRHEQVLPDCRSFLGPSGPFVPPLAAADPPAGRRKIPLPRIDRSQRRAAGGAGRAAGDARSQFRRRPARPSTKPPRPRTRPATTWPICGPGRSNSRSSPSRRSPRWRSSRRIFPRARGCAAPALPRPRPWSPRATSAAPRRSTNKRRSICSPQRGGSNRRRSTWSSPTRGSSPAARSTARLQERAGVLYPGPGYGPGGPATRGGRFPHRLLFAEARHARRSGRGLSKISRRTCRRPATDGSPLPAGRMPLGRRQAAGSPKGMAGTAEDGSASGHADRSAGAGQRTASALPVTLKRGTARARTHARRSVERPHRACAGLPRHDWPAEAAFHLAETWALPQPGNDEDLRRGVAALEDFLNRFPTHELAGAAHLQIAQSQLHLAPLRRGRGHAPALPARPALERLQGTAPGPLVVGPDLSSGKRNTRRPSPCGANISPAIRPMKAGTPCSKSVIDTEYLVGLEKFKTGDDAAATQAAGRVHGPLSAGRPQPGHPLYLRADPPSAEEMGSGHRRLAAAGRRSIRAAKRPRTPNS